MFERESAKCEASTETQHRDKRNSDFKTAKEITETESSLNSLYENYSKLIPSYENMQRKWRYDHLEFQKFSFPSLHVRFWEKKWTNAENDSLLRKSENR